MIARNLSIALLETVQQHAEAHHDGEVDPGRTLSAIGELASGFLAEIPDHDDRTAHAIALARGIGKGARQKAGHRKEAITQP